MKNKKSIKERYKEFVNSKFFKEIYHNKSDCVVYKLKD